MKLLCSPLWEVVDIFETTLEFRGISRDTMIKYLLSIAQLTHEHIITNKDMSVIINKPDWSVKVTKEEKLHVGPVVSFPRYFLTFKGNEKVVNQTIDKLRTKTIRLGG